MRTTVQCVLCGSQRGPFWLDPSTEQWVCLSHLPGRIAVRMLAEMVRQHCCCTKHAGANVCQDCPVHGQGEEEQ